MRQRLGDRLRVRWRYFPLEQVNSKEGPEWKFWEQPADAPLRGQLAFRAAAAARRQGEAAFERFHLALLRLRHVERQDLREMATVERAAEEAGLDQARWRRDMDDPDILAPIGADYIEARERYGVFGTPTFVYADGAAAYLKMRPEPSEEETMRVFELLHGIMAERRYIEEIKRPVPPAAG